MKITPINFTSFLDSELTDYWKEHYLSKGKKVEIQRTHSLKHRQTTVNAVAKDREGNTTLLSSIQLIEIPQQENNPALNGLIHLPHLQHPTQMLMVFKAEGDSRKWAKSIIDKIRILMLSAPDETEPDSAPQDTTEKSEEQDSSEISIEETIGEQLEEASETEDVEKGS